MEIIAYSRTCEVCGGDIEYNIEDDGGGWVNALVVPEHSCACVQDWSDDAREEHELNAASDWLDEQANV